jgi:hypothetical protein
MIGADDAPAAIGDRDGIVINTDCPIDQQQGCQDVSLAFRPLPPIVSNKQKST